MSLKICTFTRVIFVFIVWLFVVCPFAQARIPENIISLGDDPRSAAVVLDKSTRTLYVYARARGGIERVIKTPSLIGKDPGPKERFGDHRTPEGIYFLTQHMSRDDLIRQLGRSVAEEYGVGAYVMDYPNPIDAIFRRTGDGIWVHGMGATADKGGSRGCVVLDDDDLAYVSPHLRVHHTPVIIVPALNYVDDSGMQTAQTQYLRLLYQWMAAWTARDIERYMRFYDQDNFYSARKNWPQWRAYKNRLFRAYERIQVEVSDIKIFRYDGYLYFQFWQRFESDQYADAGLKRLLFHNTDDAYKIVSEQFWDAALILDEVALEDMVADIR